MYSGLYEILLRVPSRRMVYSSCLYHVQFKSCPFSRSLQLGLSFKCSVVLTWFRSLGFGGAAQSLEDGLVA